MALIPSFDSSPQPRQTLSTLYPPTGYAKVTLSALSSSHRCCSAHLTGAAAHPAVHPITYAYNTYLVGPAPAVTASFHTGEARRCNRCCALPSQVHRLWHPPTPAYAATQQTARTLDIQHAADEFLAAGTLIGANAYITTHMDDHADQAIALINKQGLIS
jgi:hypothetical protein